MEPTEGTRKLVYVVEDNEEQLTLLRFILNNAGFDVVTEADGDKVLSGVSALRPDIVLLDVMLPSRTGIDGFDLCRAIRSNPETSAMRVIIVSAIAEGIGDQREKIRRELGADDYFVKPYDPVMLVNRVRELIG
jgi:DNA-binding response OmpR family regulator